MAPDVRRASGTYYTPAALVADIIDAALVAAVAARLGCGECRGQRRGSSRVRRGPSPRPHASPFSIPRSDRARSCWAHSSVSRRSTRAWAKAKPLESDECWSAISSASIARARRCGWRSFRLWLAVIAGDPAERPVSVQPLPNLDCLVRQGDSLLEPSGLGAASCRPSPELAGRIGDLRRRVVTAVGPAKRPLVRELEDARGSSRARESLKSAEDSSARPHRRMSPTPRRSRDLFGGRRGIDAELRAQSRHQRRVELRGIRTARRVARAQP